MKFSIVTISFNQVDFLERAMLSVLSQEGVEIEYIVVDPGSTDGSRELIEKYRDRIDCIILEKDKGPADGLNRGFSRATGDIFAYLNSDDELVPGALARVAEAFRRYPDTDLIYSNGLVIDEDGKTIREAISSKYMSPFLYAYGAAVIVQQSSFMRAEAFRRTEGFNIENKTCWDGELMLDISMAGGSFRRIWDDWGLFRIYPGSISGSLRLAERFAQDQERLFVKVYHRKPGALDRLLSKVVRLGMLAIDPQRLLKKLV